MRHFRPLNRKAREVAASRTTDQVEAHACSTCCASFAPGWEVGSGGSIDPCPWQSDLSLCWVTCFWAGQVPDDSSNPSWMDCCGNVTTDWACLCTVPDTP
ncbi:quinohemoprotein amine dehydrogenase subunit gamma [bacterium]|nr:quinohemoprotein amine dehydrogenase subunit gamma [bacterium]